MDENNGNGDGHINTSQFVTRNECVANHAGLILDIRSIKNALWGGEGRTGIVSDIQTIKTRREMGDRVLTLVVGILSSIITAYIIRVLI